jgi:hypothetical protein
VTNDEICQIAVYEGELMRFKWLESKAVSILFFCSAVAFLTLCSFTSLALIPGVQQIVNTSRMANQLFVIPFFAVAAVAIPSMIAIFCGMAIFCVCIDRSSILKKVLWFVLFFWTGPIGSTVYYFAVYRGYIKRKREGGAGSENLLTSTS